MITNDTSPTQNEANDPKAGRCAVATGSGQLTSGARNYGFTTRSAALYIESMLASHEGARYGCTDSLEWDTLNNYDRACIAELLAHFRETVREAIRKKRRGSRTRP